MAIPHVVLHSGATMPQLGFGVWRIPNDSAENLVSMALQAGYRSIDTAALYQNEEGTGKAIVKSDVPRDEIFLTTKLWNPDHQLS